MGSKHKGKSKRGRRASAREQQRRLRHSAQRPLSSAASPAPDVLSRAAPRVQTGAQRTEDAQAGAPGDAQAEPLTEEAARMELAEQIAQDTDDVEIEEPEAGRGGRGKGRRKRATTLALVQEGQEGQEGETAPVATPDAGPEGPREVAPPPKERAEREAAGGTSSQQTQPVMARVVRRTKTLADVTMPGRLAAPRGDAPSAAEPVALEGTEDQAERAAEGEPAGGEHGDATSAPAGQAEAESQRATTGPTAALRARSRVSNATRPMPSLGPLAPQGERDGGAEREALAEGDETPGGLATSRFLWAVRRGDARLVLRAALAHVLMGLVAGVAASALLLAGSDLGFSLLGLAGVTLLCGMAAYVLPQWKGTARQAALPLVGAQLVALGWACALLGPRVGLMLLVPAAVWLALRLGGHRAALLSGVGSLVVYVAFLVAAASGAYTPALAVGAAGGTLLDAGAALVGVSLLLVGLLRTADARERSEAAARARLYELRLLRAEVARARAQAERDGFALEQALTGALRGRGIDPVTAEGALSPLAEGVNAMAERMATLQKDREDRLRLEAALRTLVRAVERGWLGLPWTWPDASGTILDDLVALLRTPRPHEQRSARRGSEELPPFVALPTAETPSRPSGPHSTANASYGNTPLPGHGWDDLLSR